MRISDWSSDVCSSDLEQTILQTKGTQNAEREKEIVERLRVAVGKSTLIHNAGVLDASSADPVTRISDGFQKVIAATYTNLTLLGGRIFTEQRSEARRVGKECGRPCRSRGSPDP